MKPAFFSNQFSLKSSQSKMYQTSFTVAIYNFINNDSKIIVLFDKIVEFLPKKRICGHKLPESSNKKKVLQDISTPFDLMTDCLGCLCFVCLSHRFFTCKHRIRARPEIKHLNVIVLLRAERQKRVETEKNIFALCECKTSLDRK